MQPLPPPQPLQPLQALRHSPQPLQALPHSPQPERAPQPLPHWSQAWVHWPQPPPQLEQAPPQSWPHPEHAPEQPLRQPPQAPSESPQPEHASPSPPHSDWISSPMQLQSWPPPPPGRDQAQIRGRIAQRIELVGAGQRDEVDLGRAHAPVQRSELGVLERAPPQRWFDASQQQARATGGQTVGGLDVQAPAIEGRDLVCIDGPARVTAVARAEPRSRAARGPQRRRCRTPTARRAIQRSAAADHFDHCRSCAAPGRARRAPA